MNIDEINSNLLRLLQNSTKILRFLKSFTCDEPKDVGVEYTDEKGETKTTNFANIAKINEQIKTKTQELDTAKSLFTDKINTKLSEMNSFLAELSNPNEKDITFSYTDEEGVLQTNTLPNIKKAINTIRAKSTLPIGSILPYTSSSVPEGFLECNGAELKRDVYARLWEHAQNSGMLAKQDEWQKDKHGFFSLGDGINTFRLPDLRGEFIRGWDNKKGIDNKRELGSLQGDAIRNITGFFYQWKYILAGGAFYPGENYSAAFDRDDRFPSKITRFDASKVVPTAKENRPRNIALMYIIKY